MTATLVARLVERGTRRGTTIAKAFPKLKDAMDPAWAPVTLAQLLANRGGAGGLDRAGSGDGSGRTGNGVEARRTLLEGVVKHAPEYEPGTSSLQRQLCIAGHVAETLGAS